MTAREKPKVIPVDNFVRDELYPGYTQAFGTQPFAVGPVGPFSKADNASYWLRDSLHFSEGMVPASTAPRKLGAVGWDMLPVYEVQRPLNDTESIWHYASEYCFPRACTDRRPKIGLPGPYGVTTELDFSPVYRNRRYCAEALVPAIRRDIQDLVAAGCDYIQIEEPLTPSRSRGPYRGKPGRSRQRGLSTASAVARSSCTSASARSAACRTPSAPTAGFPRHCSTPTCTGSAWNSTPTR